MYGFYTTILPIFCALLSHTLLLLTVLSSIYSETVLHLRLQGLNNVALFFLSLNYLYSSLLAEGK